MAKLLKQKDLKSVPAGEVVWLEQHTEGRDCLMPIVSTGDGYFGNFYLGVSPDERPSRYMRRFWNSKPYEFEREAEPWKTNDEP